MTARLLVIDDEESLLDVLTLIFRQEGHEVETASSATEGQTLLAERTYDLVMCDLHMPDGNGMDILRLVRAASPQTAVIMITAYSTTQSAIQAMRLGAYDYIAKPFDVEELKVVVERALEKAKLLQENVYLRRELEQRYTFANIVGKSPAMQDIFRLVDRVARTQSTVLLQGESGTGKELIARAVHFRGPRSENRFVSINCGALPETLLESELFGHDRGAFTGAVRDKKGLFMEADGGTLLLDEIGEMTPQMQVKLLQVIQNRTVRRVGATKEEPVNVRIIAATNRNLREMIVTGEFREDLYYRINVIPVYLPPLRQRREDIPLLVEHFLQRYGEQLGLERRSVTPAAMQCLEGYDWPGNVRELENAVERSLALTTGPAIGVEDLPPAVRARPAGPAPVSLPSEGLDLETFLDDLRASLMIQALERSEGVQTRAAELLGMSFRSFRYYARKAGLTGPAKEGES